MKKIIRNRDRIFLIVLFTILVLLNISIYHIGRYQIKIMIGQAVIAPQSICGVIQSLMFFAAIISVLINYDIGLFNSLVIFVYYIISGAIQFFLAKNYSSLPSIGNGLVVVFSLIVISNQLRKIEKESKTDLVTGLSNRRGFEEKLEYNISRRQMGYVIYYQLHNFRAVNEELGHRYGDMVLKIAAERMKKAVGGDGLVAKNDGAEYLILLSHKKNPIEVIERINKSISEKMIIQKDDILVNYYLSGSAGISTFPKDSMDASTLLKYADIAMVEARHKGEGTITFFDNNLAEKMSHTQEIERIIKDALENDYFYLVYQPQYTATEKKLRGFETLIRLKLPDGKFVSPGDFIPVAEKTDMIHRIDEYVLRRAMWEFGSIIKNADSKLILSVNVSAKGMASDNFAETIKSIIAETDFPAECLEIEITEYSFSESEEKTIKNIHVLQKMGIQIALDDFGTGYTSLAQLLKLPINLLKVDKSLIDDIENSDTHKDFIDSVIYLGHIMNCEVITEGVETQAQLDILRKYKCDLIQGYLWDKPLSFEEAVSRV